MCATAAEIGILLKNRSIEVMGSFEGRGAGKDCCSTLKTSYALDGTIFCMHYGYSNMFAGANNALSLQNRQLLKD